MAKFKTVMDSYKFVKAPSGREYLLRNGSAAEVDEVDAPFFRNQAEFYEEVVEVAESPATSPAGGASTPVSLPPTPVVPEEPEKATELPVDEDALAYDKKLEDQLFAKKPKGPWTCPICGKKGLTTKSGVRSHMGSKSCLDKAK